MKKIYIKPESNIIKIKLIDSIMEETGVIGGSKQSDWGHAAAKGGIFSDDDDDDDDVAGSKSSNLWDD
jgi:hypothetical protein